MKLQHVEALAFWPMTNNSNIILIIAFSMPVLQARGKHQVIVEPQSSR
jgi:hypothetical protein